MFRTSMTLKAWSLAAVCAWPAFGLAGAGEGDAAGLLEKTGVRGGLCLMVGAKDTAPAKELAAKSALFVQVLQGDAKLAAAWGTEFARSDFADREKLGVRNAAFEAEHYGSNLFNLIVVEDAAALGAAKLADLCRILAPNGCAALKGAPAGFADEAKALGMEIVAAGGFAAAWRKPVKAPEWKLPLEAKWQAGPRSQIANGYNGVSTGGGKLLYIEQMERNAGDLTDSAALIVARDAYNGRTLWTWELPGGYPRNDAVGLVATSRGRLFAKASTGQIVCLDGSTGKTLFEVPAKANWETRIWLVNDDLLSIHGDVRSAETGKPVWKYPNLRYQPLPGTVIGERIFFCDGTNILAKQVATGADLWKVAVPDLPKPAGPGSLARADDKLLVRMNGTKEEAAYALLDPANGKVLWTYTWKIRTDPKEQYFSSSNVRFATADGKLLLYYRHNQPGVYPDEIVATKLDLATGKPEVEDKVNKDAGDFHGCFAELHLGDYIAWYDLWVNKKTLETSKPASPHPACFFGSHSAYGMIYNFPSRKSGPVSAVGPADAVFEPAPGGKVLKKLGSQTSAADTAAGDWPVFRGSTSGGNATAAALGKDLAKVWEAKVGVGGAHFGVMSGQRTGLSQAVVAYGLAVVADIDGGRVVALDAANGKEKWVYAVGARVDYPPTLYKGLCLVAARDGWVHCLDAATGAPVYRLLAAPRERLMAKREKLESRWPLDSDVLVVNGTAYVAGGANGGVAFKPETGEVVDSKDAGAFALGHKAVPGGRDLQLHYDTVLKGNSIPRTNEDNWEGFRRGKFKDRLDARVMAFDDALTVAFNFHPAGEGWANKGKLLLKGITTDPKKPAWTTEPIELVVDDIVLTPQFAFCAGHYQRIKKDPEIWAVSREDGKTVGTVTVEGFPAFMGMSAAGKRLFVATREGKLICYECK
ncbi:MAG TPA: PQQ-binding-like beta-propeller repeat protein [Planctomycetota bacterium]|nr:PQQ-binding-like beta-propeller repeat protein [Planctomycetota bacterium]